MVNSYTLGKNSKFGEIDFSKLKSGITKEELGIQEGSVLESIWKSIDINQEGDSKDKLDRQELNRFIEIIKGLCDPKSKGDTNLSTGEAKNFETKEGEKLGGEHKEELLTFLSKLSELTKGVAKVETETTTNIEIITYEDGHSEQIKPDGSKTIISKDGKTITEKDAYDKTTKETIKTDDGETVVEYEANSTNPKKKTIKSGNSEFVILYVQGKPIKKTTTIKETGEVQEFEFVGEQPVLRKTINPKTGETVVYDDGKPSSRTVATETNEGTRVSNTVHNGNNSTENVSLNGKDRYQKKIIDGEEYEVRYDENGNTTGVIVQYGESIKAIADKFDVKPEYLVKANAHLLKGGKRSFNAGDEIVIPRKMEADEYAKAQKGRKDAEGAKAEYRAAVERQRAETARRAAEAAQREAQYKELGLINHKGEGNKIVGHYSKTNRKEEFTVIGQCNNGRTLARSKNGKLVVIAYNGVILKSEYVKNPEKYEEARKYNENVKTRKNAENLANQFYKIADKNEGFASMAKMQALLNNNINANNIVAFLDAYDREKTRQGDSSIIDTVTSEIGAGASKQQRKVLMTILEKLCQAAKKAGVSDGDIAKAKKDFIYSLNKEFAELRRTNPKDMEKAIDFLRGAIAAKQTSNVEKMDDKTAIDSFNSSFGEENASAQTAYNEARGKDGWSWSARTGDTVCGWFGCNTIEEMEAKLGKNAKAVKELANSKTEAEFKAKYKQVFGIDFDPQKIAAADAAAANYAMAQGLNQSLKIYNALLSKANVQKLTELENSIKSSLKMNDEQFNTLKNGIYSNCKTDSDKHQALQQYLRSAKQSLTTEYQKISKGKTLAQMEKDSQLVLKSAFGTNDIGKDVAQFTQNMATTEMVTDMAGDIALTVALSFVPGGAAWGAAKMAATATKWGSKGLKFARIMKKTAVAFNKVKKFEQGAKWARQAEKGSKTAKVLNITTKGAASVKNAVVGTAIYETSATNHTFDEIKEKCINNGIYGALGAGASELAPKLMQMFKISNSFATEIAEEIINAVGSLGVETAKGGEYGSTDAVIDIVSGVLMARLSHVGSAKSNPKTKSAASNSDLPKTDAPKVSDTNPELLKPEASRVGEPSPELPKTEAPKVGDPNPELPKTEDQKVDIPKANEIPPSVRNYSEMNGNELFVEYQRLRKEMSSSTLDNKANVSNINKMNEINRELEAKGFKIENDELKPIKTKSSTVDSNTNQTRKADNSKYKSSHDTGLFGTNNNIEQFDFADIGKNEKLSDYIRNNLDKKFEVLSYSDDYIKVQGTARHGKVYNFIISNQPNAKMPVLVEMFTPPSTKPEYLALNDLKKGAGTKISDDAYKSYNDKIALQNSHNNLSIENAIKNIKDKQLQDVAISIRNKMLRSQQGELMSKFDDLTKKMTFLENASDELAYNKILENLQQINNKISNPNYNKELSKLLDETIEYVDVVNTTKGRYTVQRERSTQNLDAYREKAIQDVLNHNKIAKHIGTDYTITAQTKDFVKVKVNESGCDVEYIFNTAGEPCVRKSILPPPYKKKVYSTYDTGKNKWIGASEQEWNSLNDRMLHSKDHPNNTREWEDYGRNRLAQEEKDIAFDKQFENVKTRLMDPKLSKQEKIDFYKEYYLSKIHDDLKLSCDKLGLNVDEMEHIMLDMINKYDMPLYLDKNIKPMDIISVKNELDAWYKASNGTAKFPTLLDLTHLDKHFYRSRYGGSNVTGYKHHGDSHISVDGSLPFDTTLRHELTHLNDMQPRTIGKFGKNNEIDLTNNKDFEDGKWYREELEHAGITNIDYAYTNKLEFIAVAAEGDFTKYSPEFKQVLVDLGMPEWIFKLDSNKTVNPNLGRKPVADTPTIPTRKPVVDSPSSSKFGTPENPIYNEFYNPNLTEQDLRDALEFIEKMPDDDTMKSILKQNITKRLGNTTSTITVNNDIDDIIINNPIYKKWNTIIENAKSTGNLKDIGPELRMIKDDNIRNSLLQVLEKKREELWTLAANTNASGFARVKDTKTNVQNLTEQDVFFCGRTQNGANFVDISQNSNYTSITRGQKNGHTLIEEADMARLLIDAPRITSYYSEKLNMTGIQIDVRIGRGSNFCIYFKGQVSEVDAKRLAQHLESIRLNPNDSKSPKLIPDNPDNVSGHEWSLIGKRVQEEVVKFFRTL